MTRAFLRERLEANQRATKCDAAVTGRDYLFRGCDAGALTICYEVSLGLASLGSECSNTVYKLPHLRIRVIASGTVIDDALRGSPHLCRPIRSFSLRTVLWLTPSRPDDASGSQATRACGTRGRPQLPQRARL